MVKLWTCTFRLAPVKDISIPMFELLAYFLLNRLIASVKIAVESEVEIVFCSTDSQIVLWWIWQVHKEWNVWVQNWAEKIRENVDCKNWFHVPTALNPADICTRVCLGKRLKECSFWWNGPKFLLVGEMWPSQEFLLSEGKDLEENVVDSCRDSSVNVCGLENIGVDEVIDIGRFSSLDKLKNVFNKSEDLNRELLLEVENAK